LELLEHLLEIFPEMNSPIFESHEPPLLVDEMGLSHQKLGRFCVKGLPLHHPLREAGYEEERREEGEPDTTV
jgi:hypothetical protein